jgi:hypothetical protein
MHRKYTSTSKRSIELTGIRPSPQESSASGTAFLPSRKSGPINPCCSPNSHLRRRLLCSLLSQNHDVLSSILNSYEVWTASRKRSRSPSPDAMGGADPSFHPLRNRSRKAYYVTFSIWRFNSPLSIVQQEPMEIKNRSRVFVSQRMPYGLTQTT